MTNPNGMTAQERVLAVWPDAVCRFVVIGPGEWYQVDTTPESRVELGYSAFGSDEAWENAASRLAPAEPQEQTFEEWRDTHSHMPTFLLQGHKRTAELVWDAREATIRQQDEEIAQLREKFDSAMRSRQDWRGRALEAESALSQLQAQVDQVQREQTFEEWALTYGLPDTERTTARAAWNAARSMQVDQAFNEGVEMSAMRQCSRCASGVPLVYKDYGSWGQDVHEYHKGSDYRECSARYIRALKRAPHQTEETK